jgi:nitrogen fixation NifU-like protein
MDGSQFYSDLILEHNRDKRNKRQLTPFDLEEHGHNPSCGDDLTLRVKVDNGVITDAAYQGVGCAISQASASMMIDDIKGKTVEEALILVDTFLGMIKREITDEAELEKLDEAIALQNISNMPARVKCAVLAWHTLKAAIEGKNDIK